ncbi:hypothetical protein N7478_012837 [Penicillium angulare]|uniref:uncharacterized protein n=1 Tax=Penicillium angulare TaxID=116970 RepID=UPI002541D31E|nr:uncharacterized protein N7478_012837 [Penicillium angulare]KAJ5256733.1 hypothetical protein N7478_012837 [Penicillium angulare]
MQVLLLLLLGVYASSVVSRPYSISNVDSLASPPTEDASVSMGYESDETIQVFEIRDEGERDMIFARDTTESSDSSTTSTTESTTSETTTTSDSTTSTSTTSSTTTTSDSTTSSTTTTSSASSTSSSTTSTSTSSSSSSTSSTSTSTTSTATATSTESAATKKRNHKGNVDAIIFSCCLLSFFAGVSILHCARDRAKSKRIAARDLLKATAVTPEPIIPKNESTTNLLGDRSSVLFRDNTPNDPLAPFTATGTGAGPGAGAGTTTPTHGLENH